MINIRPQRPGAFSKLLLYKDMIYVISTLKEIQCQTYLSRPASLLLAGRLLVIKKIKSFIKRVLNKCICLNMRTEKFRVSQA